MPWKIDENASQYCVYKTNEAGDRGELEKCYETKAEAEALMRALYANVEETVKGGDPISEVFQELTVQEMTQEGERIIIRETRNHALRGEYPTIVNYDDVDMEMLTKGDDDPFFVVLPIAEAARTSRNNLYYDEELLESIATQLRGKGGVRGHIPIEEIGTSFPVDDVHWVGHAREGSKLWAKGYIPPGQTRDDIRRRKARNGGLSTSIYGNAVAKKEVDGTRRVLEFELQQVDLAPPQRAALPVTGGFTIVHEMAQGEEPMSEQDIRTQVREMSPEMLFETLSETVKESIALDYVKRSGKKLVDADVATGDAERVRITELETSNSKLLRENKAQAEVIAEYQKVAFNSALDVAVNESLNWNTPDETSKTRLGALRKQLRGLVVVEMGSSSDIAQARVKIAEIMERDDFRPLVEMTRDVLSGGTAIVGGKADKEINPDAILAAIGYDASRFERAN